MAGFVVLWIFWGALWSIPAAFAKGLLTLALLLIGWGPLALYLWWKASQSEKGASRHAAALAESGIPVGQGLDHTEDGTGIAIDRPFRLLLLMGPDGHKSYPYVDVREWSARQGAQGFVAGSTIQAVGANARMEREAKKETGLFVTVRDVERPLWRVAMKDASTRARWMEILQQEINEGGVQDARPSPAGATALNGDVAFARGEH